MGVVAQLGRVVDALLVSRERWKQGYPGSTPTQRFHPQKKLKKKFDSKMIESELTSRHLKFFQFFSTFSHVSLRELIASELISRRFLKSFFTCYVCDLISYLLLLSECAENIKDARNNVRRRRPCEKRKRGGG